MSIKSERIGSDYVREISKIIRDEVDDESIKAITVTYVRVTEDLSYAKVYITTLLEDKKNTILEQLNKAAPFIRTHLADRVKLRHTPELEFVYDDSISYGEKIENIIDKINENK